jgi:hypothetical protein
VKKMEVVNSMDVPLIAFRWFLLPFEYDGTETLLTRWLCSYKTWEENLWTCRNIRTRTDKCVRSAAISVPGTTGDGHVCTVARWPRGEHRRSSRCRHTVPSLPPSLMSDFILHNACRSLAQSNQFYYRRQTSSGYMHL